MITTLLSTVFSSGLVAKILGGGAILAYLYSLYARYQGMVRQQATAQVESKLNNVNQEITSQNATVAEDIRDYENAKNEFNTSTTGSTDNTKPKS